MLTALQWFIQRWKVASFMPSSLAASDLAKGIRALLLLTGACPARACYPAKVLLISILVCRTLGGAGSGYKEEVGGSKV